MTEDTPLQRQVRDIQVRVEEAQRPALKLCRNDYQRSEVIRSYGALADMLIDVVSQQHGMRPMSRRKPYDPRD
jgi:hypothetical protein